MSQLRKEEKDSSYSIISLRLHIKSKDKLSVWTWVFFVLFIAVIVVLHRLVMSTPWLGELMKQLF
ncbi:hypothetical protein [Xanthomonas sp. GPE 39]|uniref:hypothetical protein n=1 Tax=Xanthomonas sp. GPE 39 TaxID=1583099 RepID=UPI0005F29471|nr:hypothetical protein [Xanthomonas sp. GPE 39]